MELFYDVYFGFLCCFYFLIGILGILSCKSKDDALMVFVIWAIAIIISIFLSIAHNRYQEINYVVVTFPILIFAATCAIETYENDNENIKNNLQKLNVELSDIYYVLPVLALGLVFLL